MQLEAHRISFRYPKGPWILRQFSMAIEAGEVVGLTGPSGCGKTSLCRLLAGYAHPVEGEIKIGGGPLPIRGYHPVQLIHQHPEQAINPRWTMRRVMHEAWQPDKKLLAAIGIDEEWLARYPNELSGGELQRICIARALAPQTRFLIADEMTTMLDAVTQAQIWHTMLQLIRERNIGLIVVSHESRLIHRLCDRVIQLA